MNNYIDKVIEEVKNGFNKNRGKGSIYLVPPIDIYKVSSNIIASIIEKTPTAKIFVITDTFNNRQKILELLKQTDLNINKVTILSKAFVDLKYISNYKYFFGMTIGINTIEDIDYILELSKISKFTLSILTENTMNRYFITRVRQVLPDIITNISAVEARKAIVSSPVEERRCPVYMTEDDTKLYAKYSNFIKDSMSIFGDIDTVNKCRLGDTINHLSAMDVRLQLAQANGWSYDLDTTIDFMKQIDDVYNPIAIAERADLIYNIIRQRKTLVLDNKSKIDKILEILDEVDKCIIISKNGDFARLITEKINEKYGDYTCVDYHDAIPDSYIKDENGEYVKWKSGKCKGEPRLFRSQALSTIYLQYFNSGISKVLSIKNSSNTDLKTACNTIILTSPLLDNIIDIRNRFINVNFGENTIVYKLYCKETIEENEILNEKQNHLIRVKNMDEENITFDKNSGEIVL